MTATNPNKLSFDDVTNLLAENKDADWFCTPAGWLQSCVATDGKPLVISHREGSDPGFSEKPEGARTFYFTVVHGDKDYTAPPAKWVRGRKTSTPEYDHIEGYSGQIRLSKRMAVQLESVGPAL